MNKRTPFYVNKDIRADSTFANGNEFTYLYTFLGDTSSSFFKEDRRASRTRLINGICSQNGLLDFSNRGTKFIYLYRDKQGSFIKKIEIPAYECVQKIDEQRQAARELAVILHEEVEKLARIVVNKKDRMELIGCVETILLHSRLMGTVAEREKLLEEAQVEALEKCYDM